MPIFYLKERVLDAVQVVVHFVRIQGAQANLLETVLDVLRLEVLTGRAEDVDEQREVGEYGRISSSQIEFQELHQSSVSEIIGFFFDSFHDPGLQY